MKNGQMLTLHELSVIYDKSEAAIRSMVRQKGIPFTKEKNIYHFDIDVFQSMVPYDKPNMTLLVNMSRSSLEKSLGQMHLILALLFYAMKKHGLMDKQKSYAELLRASECLDMKDAFGIIKEIERTTPSNKTNELSNLLDLWNSLLNAKVDKS